MFFELKKNLIIKYYIIVIKSLIIYINIKNILVFLKKFSLYLNLITCLIDNNIIIYFYLFNNFILIVII